METAMLRTLLVAAAILSQLSPPAFASRRGASLRQLLRAEEKAPIAGRRVLATGREMIVGRAEIIPGSCWDYANAVYERCGYPSSKRHVVFSGGKKKGYADPAAIHSGDWLYYINHSYGNVDHSAIFVGWTNLGKKRALMLSYPGENRMEPGRYRVYDLSHVYKIVRPG
jgi:hypothetical protein